MKVRRFFLFAVVIMTFVMVVAFQGQAFCALIEIDFETSQGYSPGNLYGQPSTGTSWCGNDTVDIQVTASEHQEGSQSLMVKAGSGGTGGTDYLNIGSVPDKFTWKFYWKPENTYSGWTRTWLGSSSDLRDGPYLGFTGDDSIYYYSDGYTHSIIDGLNQTDWLAVVIVGDITAKTFDVYLDGASGPTATGCSFNGDPTGLSWHGFESPAYFGANTHYYDADHVGEVPIPGAVWLFGSGLIGFVAVRRRFTKN